MRLRDHDGAVKMTLRRGFAAACQASPFLPSACPPLIEWPVLQSHASMRVLAAFLALCAALAGFSPVEAAPRPGTVELKGPKGVMGPLAVEVMDDGASYVPADRLAALLKGSWVVKGKAGTLTVAKRTAQFGRDQSRVSLQGQPLVLDSAARATSKGWLLPMDFLDKGLPRLAPGTSVV